MEIKIKLKVKNLGDVENSIVSIVFTVEKEFTFDDIIDLTIKYLDSHKFLYSKKKLEKCIDDKLDLLEKYNYVTCCDSIYKTTNYHKVSTTKANVDFIEEEKTDLGIL